MKRSVQNITILNPKLKFIFTDILYRYTFFRLQLRGKLRVELKPLLPRSPLVGGMTIAFLEVPVSMLLSGS